MSGKPADTAEVIRRLKSRLRRAASARRELQRRVFHLKTLYDVSREVGFLVDTSEIAGNLLLMTVGTFGALRGFLVLVDVDHDRLESFTQRGMDDAVLPLTKAIEAGAFRGLAGAEGVRLLRRPARTRAGTRPELLRLLAEADIRLWVPFRVNEQLAGGLGLGDKLAGDPYSKDDQELLSTLCNQGAVALKNAISHQEVVRYAAELEASLRRIQMLESVKSHLAKFVPKTVQELIEESPEAPSFEKRELDLSVLFADITAYTRLSSELRLDRLNELVERYFGAFLDEILRLGGDVNETAGDGIMVIFRKRDPRRHARAAVRAALGILRRTREINAELAGRFEPITMKVGVNSGIAAVGATKIEGAAGIRWTYTASGPTTNIAARLAALADGSAVIVSQATRERLGEEFEAEDLGPRPLKNVAEAVRVYRVGMPASEPGTRARVDHRQHPRRPVSRRIRIWIDDQAWDGELTEASARGVRATGLPGGLLTIGQICRIAVETGSGGEFVCTGRVRHVSGGGVGIETSEVLPDAP